MTEDEQHLKLLSIFHYVVGGLTAFFALFPLFHIIMGLVLVFAPEKFHGGDGPPPALFGWMFVVLGAAFILLGWTLAVFILVTGRFLARRRRYMLCFVVACVECLFMPFGTILGVFTIVVLNRDSVKNLFAVSSPSTR
jgi:hypothetical protein